MKVLIAAAEAVPFGKVGGLADVAGALPPALSRGGVDCTLIVPYYEKILAKAKGAPAVERAEDIGPVDIDVAGKTVTAEFYRSRLPGSNVEAVLVGGRPEGGGEGYFDRAGIYDDPDSSEGYPDNAERFCFFSRAVVEYARASGKSFDVIHANDSHTALVPALLKAVRPGRELGGVKTLLSIHNLGYQGVHEASDFAFTGLPAELFHAPGPFEYYGKFNLMKAGIVHADIINTVSRKYAEEIQSSEEFGFGLEGVLRDRSADVYGIVNGVDYSVWNPEIDEMIPAKFSAGDASGKAECKRSLLEKSGIPAASANMPIVGIISRLADQKGFDLIAEVADEIMARQLVLVVLGTGKPEYHQLFTSLKERYPDRVGCFLAFDNSIAHLIEAGSDMFLMPSRYEPCGLNQLYSFKYGTIPVVRRTGGLADTVIDYDSNPAEGAGFGFEEYSGQAMLSAIDRALTRFFEPDTWPEIVRRAMTLDFSWEAAAKKYISLYEKLAARG